MTLANVALASELILMDGGTFQMGSDPHYREEGPVREVTVSPFMIGRTEVTVAEFRAFVEETGYITTAERGLTAEENPTGLRNSSRQVPWSSPNPLSRPTSPIPTDGGAGSISARSSTITAATSSHGSSAPI
ncbi:MAG: formylglycine-generating enzyme family protein [Roseobacter sp.]